MLNRDKAARFEPGRDDKQRRRRRKKKITCVVCACVSSRTLSLKYVSSGSRRRYMETRYIGGIPGQITQLKATHIHKDRAR